MTDEPGGELDIQAFASGVMREVATRPRPTPARALGRALRTRSLRDGAAAVVVAWHLSTTRTLSVAPATRARSVALVMGVVLALCAGSLVAAKTAQVVVTTIADGINAGQSGVDEQGETQQQTPGEGQGGQGDGAEPGDGAGGGSADPGGNDTGRDQGTQVDDGGQQGADPGDSGASGQDGSSGDQSGANDGTGADEHDEAASQDAGSGSQGQQGADDHSTTGGKGNDHAGSGQGEGGQKGDTNGGPPPTGGGDNGGSGGDQDQP
ncbi:MAG TPA: hypothetical protein VGK17_23000 [Propionicimonas sp.]